MLDHRLANSSVLITCEDSDPGCLECAGQCTREITCRLFRVDMPDQTGTTFCDPCATDALASGCFRVEEAL